MNPWFLFLYLFQTLAKFFYFLTGFSLQTAMCLRYNPHSIALAALYISCKCLNFSPPEVESSDAAVEPKDGEGQGAREVEEKEFSYWLRQGISFQELDGKLFASFFGVTNFQILFTVLTLFNFDSQPSLHFFSNHVTYCHF
jgi:hypothetical protein